MPTFWRFVIPMLAYAGVAQAQGFDTRTALGLSGPQPVVMVLGTHHMGNPNHDKVKSSFDDPRSPQRQAQLRVLLDHIKKFKPTKIAVEAPFGSTAVPNEYAAYRRGQYELTANEVDQVAFRLAKELDLPTVYPIDWRKDMDLDGVMQFASSHGQQNLEDGFEKVFGAIGQWQSALQQKPLLDIYREQNDPKFVNDAQGLYIRMIEVGKDTTYKGADAVAGWYERNLKIAANVLRVATAPTDRVLVLIGSGHAYYLNEILGHSPAVSVESALRYLAP